jgi:electron transfer flavoprotein beta subunit
MKIVVCVSTVPDSTTKIKVGGSGKSIDDAGVTFIINPYDEYAVEEALKLKEKSGAGEVVIITLGSDNSKETIRKALAMGADSGILLKDEAQRDSLVLPQQTGYNTMLATGNEYQQMPGYGKLAKAMQGMAGGMMG